MTHFLFTLWDGAGTLPPELSVARALVGRGHRAADELEGAHPAARPVAA